MRALVLSTVSEFYRQRTGTFFVILGVLFGFLSSNEHRAFAIFFLTADFGMLYLFCIWLLYSILCIQYVVQLWRKPEYTFVYDFRLFSLFDRLREQAILSFGLLQPLFFYGIYLIIIGLTEHVAPKLFLVFIFFLILTAMLVAAMEWRIRNPELYVSKNAVSWIKWNFPRPVSWTWWTLEYLFRVKGVTVLICKTGAMLVFMGTVMYYSSDTYDIRLLGVGLSMGYLLNIGLSYEIYRWHTQIWLWNRTLPIPIVRRYTSMVLLHALLILPETLIVLRADTILLVEAFQLFLLGLSLLLLFYAWLNKKGGELEDYGKLVLSGYVILTLLILYRVPIVLLAVGGLILSRYFFRKWYYSS